MSRIMVQESASGEKRVCDGKCYNALGPDCDCICGGMNHGVGYIQAVKNVEDLINNERKLDHYDFERPEVNDE